MLYAILFEDDPNRADERAKHMAAHLGFLEANAAVIQAAGPLKDAKDGAAAGGLWLVEAESAEAAEALVEKDPFWPTGLRKSVRVLAWTQVFASGRRQVPA
ncbi:YciI family protein [Algihabitans albus]|uniref:YciI family protein n=1 Tax=Algihabitans albus TaxID=2164067 RepID=UPI000E5CC76A|nr:YciI family protein [Algihabitans albus]